jgi:hypothetical protein
MPDRFSKLIFGDGLAVTPDEDDPRIVTISAGAAAPAGGGIQYGVHNSGTWLDIATTDVDSLQGVQWHIDLDSHAASGGMFIDVLTASANVHRGLDVQMTPSNTTSSSLSYAITAGSSGIGSGRATGFKFDVGTANGAAIGGQIGVFTTGSGAGTGLQIDCDTGGAGTCIGLRVDATNSGGTGVIYPARFYSDGVLMFEIREDGSLHGKTGKALTFDL